MCAYYLCAPKPRTITHVTGPSTYRTVARYAPVAQLQNLNQWQLRNTTTVSGADLLSMTDEEDERATNYLVWVAQSGMMYSVTLEPGEALNVQLLLFMAFQDPEQVGPLTREGRLLQMNPRTVLQVQPLTSSLASYIAGLRIYRPVITFLASDERYALEVNRAAAQLGIFDRDLTGIRGNFIITYEEVDKRMSNVAQLEFRFVTTLNGLP